MDPVNLPVLILSIDVELSPIRHSLNGAADGVEAVAMVYVDLALRARRMNGEDGNQRRSSNQNKRFSAHRQLPGNVTGFLDHCTAAYPAAGS